MLIKFWIIFPYNVCIHHWPKINQDLLSGYTGQDLRKLKIDSELIQKTGPHKCSIYFISVSIYDQIILKHCFSAHWPVLRLLCSQHDRLFLISPKCTLPLHEINMPSLRKEKKFESIGQNYLSSANVLITKIPDKSVFLSLSQYQNYSVTSAKINLLPRHSIFYWK